MSYFNFALKTLNFTRAPFSQGEKRAFELIKYELDKLNLKYEVEDVYGLDSSEKLARLEVLEPYKKTYLARAYALSGSTRYDGVVGDLKYIEDGLEQNLYDAYGQIVLANGRMVPDLYSKLLAKKVKSFITFCGSLYDDDNILESKSLTLKQYEMGKIPGIVIHIKDALEIIKNKATKCKVTVLQEDYEDITHNLIVTIPGQIAYESICVSTHYDSTSLSNGLLDNATGVSMTLDLIKYFSQNKPYRTLKFVFLGASNRNYAGASQFVEEYQDYLKNVKLNVNIDMVGSSLGQDVIYNAADLSMQTFIHVLAKENDYDVVIRNQTCPSDSLYFSSKYIPSITIHREIPCGGPMPHLKNDETYFLNETMYNKTLEFTIVALKRLLNSKLFLIPYRIPTNIVEDVDKILNRKKRFN